MTTEQTRVIGRSPQRFGGADRVTGRQDYVADVRLPGALEAKLVTVDCAHARIHGIDTSAALAIPGVRTVLTAADLPQPVPRFGPQLRDRPVLAAGETLYHGEPVAIVAADTVAAATAGAAAVRVDYDALPAVLTIADALAPDAPLVRDPALRAPDDPRARTNVIDEHRYGWGDVAAAEADADLVVEGTYTFPMVTHFALEPHAFIAAPDAGGIVAWSSIQHPSWLQKTLAEVLGLPLSRVRVIAPDPGGGFGGKQHAKYEPLVAFLALRSGRPVRLVLTLEETFQAVRRTSTTVRVRAGLRRDGTLVFEDVEASYLLGAYVDIADRVVGKGTYPAAGPYRVPAVRIHSRVLLSHTTPATAFRGFGNPQVNWAVESILTDAAAQLGLDPLELRLRNLARPGEAFIPGDQPADGDWAQSVRRAAELAGWDRPKAPGHGRGIAIGIKSGPTTGLSYSIVRLLADGSAIVSAGTSDMGQGARTVFAQIAAEELGTPLDAVTVVMGDTAVVPYDQQTSASRATAFMGNAVLLACRDVAAQLAARAAGAYGVEPADVRVEHGAVTLGGGRVVPVAEAVRKALGSLGGEIIGRGEVRKDSEKGHPLGGRAAFWEFNCTAVEAAVDTATGDVEIVRHVTVSDVGRALNPLQVRMQDEGAALQGLGHTLMEQLIHDDRGRIRNRGAIDYRIPTSMDVPDELVGDIVENGDGPGPYGAKGMSEGALLPVAAAVAGAVRDATGVAIHDLPLTPERVWRALHDRAGTAPVAVPEPAERRVPVGSGAGG